MAEIGKIMTQQAIFQTGDYWHWNQPPPWQWEPQYIAPPQVIWPTITSDDKDAKIAALEAEVARLHKLIEAIAKK